MTFTAIRDGDPDVVCALLKLRRTGDYGSFLDAMYAGIVLPSGWYTIVSNGPCLFCDNAILSSLSANTTILSCFLEEHVMYSSISFWENGSESWCLTHDCNNGLDHLERTGTIPTVIAEIADHHFARQEKAGGVDSCTDYVFDVPAKVMAYYTGLQYGEYNPDVVDQFETLEQIRVGLIRRILAFVNPHWAT